MKPASLLLAASLVANAALVAAYVTRSPAPAPATSGATPVRTSAAGSRASADALRAALASGDAAALRAAGLSPDLARDLALGRAFAKVSDRVRAVRAQQTGDAPWWRNRGTPTASREQILLARRELADALTSAIGDDLGLGGGDNSQLAFLSPEKRDALRRITQDYDEMMAKFSAGGIQLASDKEKLRLLRAERDRDIAALLSPDERLAYEMRTSPSGSIVRSRYGDAIETEAEFQKIYALQKAFDDKFPRESLTGRISPETLRARSEAERQLDADLRAAVGDDRYSALRRAADPDLRNVDALVTRLGLPPATTNQVVTARESFATESQRINNDTSVPFPQRRTQIQELATRAKADLARTLGSEAADAYAQNSQWVNMLQNGMAYATTPPPNTPGSIGVGGNQSIYPVMPAGVNAGNAQRTVFVSGTPVADGGTLTLGSDRAGQNSNVQVMTFSTTATDAAHGGPVPGTATRMITVAPPAEGQPAPAAPSPAPTPPR